MNLIPRDPQGLMKYLYSGAVEGSGLGSPNRIAGLLGSDAIEGQFTRVPQTAGLLGRTAGRVIPPISAAFAAKSIYDMANEEPLPPDYKPPSGFSGTPFGAMLGMTGADKAAAGGGDSFGVLKQDANIGANPYADELYAGLFDTQEKKGTVKPAPKDPSQMLQEVQVQGKKFTPIEFKQNSAGLAEQMTQGLPKEEKTALNKFAGEFDLTTVGMALLASNDGSGNLSSNLGQALMLGRAAKQAQDSAEVEASRYERKESRKDREAAVEEAKAKYEAMKAQAQAGKYEAEAGAVPAKVAAEQERAAAATATAQAAQARAQASGVAANAAMIKAQRPDTATETSQRMADAATITNYIGSTGVVAGYDDLDATQKKALATAGGNLLTDLRKKNAARGNPMSESQLIQMAVDVSMTDAGRTKQDIAPWYSSEKIGYK